MKGKILPIVVSLLILSLAGCSLLPSDDALPTPTEEPNTRPASGYEPQPGDEKLKRDPVFVDLDNSSLAIMESYPIQVNAILNGNLPDPCHELRVVVTKADINKEIQLEVYSVVDTSMACIQVIEPFNATIPLGSYTGGHYSVYVNGELLKEFDS